MGRNKRGGGFGLFCLLARQCRWMWLCAACALWAVFSLRVCRSYGAVKFADCVQLAFWSRGQNLLLVALRVLSWSIPMAAVLQLLEPPMSEAFYYARAVNRRRVAAARVCVLLVVNLVSVLVILGWMVLACGPRVDPGMALWVAGNLVLERLFWALLLQVQACFGGNLYVGFTVAAVLQVGAVWLGIGMPRAGGIACWLL